MSVNLVQVFILETKLNGTLAPSTTGRIIGRGTSRWLSSLLSPLILVTIDQNK